jgi:hypothetical protein
VLGASIDEGAQARGEPVAQETSERVAVEEVALDAAVAQEVQAARVEAGE